MSVIETLATEIGLELARALARSAFRDDTEGNLEEILFRHIEGYVNRRKAVRHFEGLADDISEKLSPFLEVEFRDLSDNDKRAAIIAVGRSLGNTTIGSSLLSRLDFDPNRLEEHVRASGPRARGLGEAGGALYDVLLTEACTYTVEVALSLMGHESAALQELLIRTTYLRDLIEKVFEALPRQGAIAGGTDEDYELRYRREVARVLDRLELFGLTVDESVRRYALSVAYISLTMRRDAEHQEAAEDIPRLDVESEAPDDPEDETDSDYVRVDQALSGMNRVLVRGVAGCGKTTLLQWLAVQSARSNFEDELDEWNETVPFFIQLRRYADSDLPAPEAFTTQVAAALRGMEPSGWVHRLLNQGRGLILIDGVDELPEQRWPDVQEWIAGLVANFPDNRYLVTSRPGALRGGWLQIDNVVSAELEPMTPQDVAAFIDHWHDAARETKTHIPSEEISNYAASLKAMVREIPALRSLATLPLLAAMLCALHLERRSQLPRDRMQLYDTALEMLLERRDVERRIPQEAGATLTRQQKEILLGKLANWLVLNAQSDIEKTRAIGHIRGELSTMPTVEDDAQPVFEVLLRRSGLIREPVVGRIDFIHRTFQEFLAAKQIVAEDNLELLVNNAHLDGWREVVILAVGHARQHERELLIRGLLERGSAEDDVRHLLHLLAIACLETAPQLSSELTEAVTERLGELLPPTNMTEARAVASAGDLAAPFLDGFQGERATTAAACVRALSLIGTDRALAVLESYGPDQRVTVSRELIRAWPIFEPVEYAKRVLSESVLNYFKLTVEDPSILPGLRHLRTLRDLRCQLSGSVELDHLSDLVSLSALRVSRSPVEDLSVLSSTDRLSTLSLINCPNVADLSPLRNHPALSAVRLSRCSSIFDLSVLGSLGQLESAVLDNLAGVSDYTPLSHAVGLQSLDISNTEMLESVDWLIGYADLRDLSLQMCPSLSGLPEIPSSLHRLQLSYIKKDMSLDFLQRLTNLESLVVEGNSTLDSFEILQGLQDLRRLVIVNCHSLVDISAVSSLDHLEVLLIVGATELNDLSPLQQPPGALRRIGIGGLGPRATYGWLEELRDVRVSVARGSSESMGGGFSGFPFYVGPYLNWHPSRLIRKA